MEGSSIVYNYIVYMVMCVVVFIVHAGEGGWRDRVCLYMSY